MDAAGCGWMDNSPEASPVSPNWKVVKGALRTIAGGSAKVYKLKSPNLRSAAYNCKMVMTFNIKSNSQSTALYVEHIMSKLN